jgi:predicted ATPase
LAILADAYGRDGQLTESRQTLTEALALVQETGERLYEAELYRLKGELALQQSRAPRPASSAGNPQSAFRDPQLEAEACFHQALAIARRQQAKSLELRAGMSLSWLWRQQGRPDEARGMLAEIYGWFTQGFDTKDLQAARALLEELS